MEQMSIKHGEEITLLKGQMDAIMASFTVKDLALQQLNTQHSTLGSTCGGLRTDVKRLDTVSGGLRVDLDKLDMRSCRQENDISEVENRVHGKADHVPDHSGCTSFHNHIIHPQAQMGMWEN